ncbi:MAG: hypothetical protein WKH64_19230, partial [Chloroflexia bacterium]
GATKIIDLATLTGAVVVALGAVHVGGLGTDQAVIDEIIAAGQEVGEKFWQLPLDKEYSKQIKSDIADIKNVGGRKAGTITAAAFIKEFADGVSWAHLDIAGTGRTDKRSHIARKVQPARGNALLTQLSRTNGGKLASSRCKNHDRQACEGGRFNFVFT